MENFRKNKAIIQDPKSNNSYLIYNTIYTNKSHEKDQLLAWTSNITYSAGLYLDSNNSILSLEIFENDFNVKTETVDFSLKHRVRLKSSIIDYSSQPSEDHAIEMHFAAERFIIIEVVFKKLLLVNFLTGEFSTTSLKAPIKGGKFTPLKILFTYDEFWKNDTHANGSPTHSNNPSNVQSNNFSNIHSRAFANSAYPSLATKETNTSTMSNHSTLQAEKVLKTNSSQQERTATANLQTKQPKFKRRTYVFVTNKNILYYLIINDDYSFDKVMVFKRTSISLEGEDLITQMNVVRINKEDKCGYVIFILTKKSLTIIPTDYSRTSLKAFLINNNYNKSNYYRIKYKFECGGSVDLQLIARYSGESQSNIYIVTKGHLLTIQVDWLNLRQTAKEMGGVLSKDVINIGKLNVDINKGTYKITPLNQCNCITEATENDGNIIIYNKNNKSLEIYYDDGSYSEKVCNYKDMSLIKFVRFPKFRSSFFAINNTFNRISFNKKLYWYSEKWQVSNNFNQSQTAREPFLIPQMKETFVCIHNNYVVEARRKYKRCELCNRENASVKCQVPLCSCYYCSEEHRDSDYKQFHFFHCKLNTFFIHHKYETQMKFFNQFIIVIGDIIKTILSFIEGKEEYLFYLPYVKRISELFQILGIKYLSDTVFDMSTKQPLFESEMKKLLFYQEVTFFYYNIIILYLNFGIKGGMMLFVEKEIESLGAEMLFNKPSFMSTLFKKENHFYQEITFLPEENYFFIDEDYLQSLTYLKQNDILLGEVINLYANFFHIIDKVFKESPLSYINLSSFDFKLKSQLLVLFEDRGPDEVTRYFYAYMTPHICLNKKMYIAERYLKKVETALSSDSVPVTIFNVVSAHNLGLIQFSIGKFLDGIHNLENSFHLLNEHKFSYSLRIEICERLGLAYINIRELMKSFCMFKEAMNLRSKLNTVENKMKLIHLSSYINYIKDFVEYEYKIKCQEDKEKKRQEVTYRKYQRSLIDYVLGRYDTRQRSLIDLYCKDYFRATEFIYELNKDILAKLNADNQSKKSTIISKEDHSNIHDNEKVKVVNQSDYSTFSALNPIKENIEKEEILEFENEIDIKETVFDQLARNGQYMLTSINSHFFTRTIILRDYYGPIASFNINYHPNYSVEFKKIIDNAKHHFFLKELTHSNIVELGNYFGNENNCLDGFSRYLQQEEIQTMFKVELSKMQKATHDTSASTSNPQTLRTDKLESNEEKEKWVSGIKEMILSQKNRSPKEIDRALYQLYDGLNEEYREEIWKNPELILYYIFCDIEGNNSIVSTEEECE